MTTKPHWSADKTGNIAIDTITAGMSHYRKFGRTCYEIRLSKLWWVLFREWLKEFAPELDCEDEIIFKQCTFKYGGKVMNENVMFFTKLKGTSLDTANGKI